jgi:hypothetical protein
MTAQSALDDEEPTAKKARNLANYVEVIVTHKPSDAVRQSRQHEKSSPPEKKSLFIIQEVAKLSAVFVPLIEDMEASNIMVILFGSFTLSHPKKLT